jgi:hypothetical protein
MTTAIANCDAASVCNPGSDGQRELQRALRASVSEALDVRRRGHGLQGMVHAIRDSLARGDDANELAAKIDTALDAASKHLAEQGYDQDQIDAAVSRFRDRLAREIDAIAGQGSMGASGTAQRVAVAEASREVKRERFSLDILTAEGDRVSIRFKSLTVTDVAAAQVSDGQNTSTAVQASVISRGRFKVEVDGDLNEAERAAMGDLLDKVDDIAEDFFGGDVQEAFAAAARVGLDSDALSAFSLRLSYSKSTAMAAKAYATTAALTDAPSAPATPVVPAASKPVTTDPVAPTKVADVVATPVATDTTTAPVPAPLPDVPSARQTIASFTKDVLAKLSTAGENGVVRLSMRWKVDFLLTAIESVSKTPTQQAATNALGQALDGQTSAA